MDISDAIGLEFLDFTGIDESEKNKLLALLQLSKQSLKLPWSIGSKTFDSKTQKKPIEENVLQNVAVNTNINVVSKRTPIPIINPKNGLEVTISNGTSEQVDSRANPPLNGQYFTPVTQYYPQPVSSIHHNVPVHLTPNYTMNPSTTHHPIHVNTVYTSYIAPNCGMKQSVYFGQPIFVSPPITDSPVSFYENQVPQYVDNVAELPVQTPVQATEPLVDKEQKNLNDKHDDENNVSSVTTTVVTNALLSVDSPVFTPKNPPAELAEKKQQLPTPKNEVHADTPTPCANKDSTPPEANAWSGRKSFASLFSSKQSSSVPQVNGVPKPVQIAAENNVVNNKEIISNIKKSKPTKIIDPDCYRMGEFLTSYSIDGRATSLQPRGLINQSNYCYINSILQALLACPPMYNLLSALAQIISSNEKRKPTPVIDGMCKFVNEFKHLPASMRINNRRSDAKKDRDYKKDQSTLISTDNPFEPNWIYKVLNGLRTDLIEGRQEDAEEFLGCLLNHLNDEMLELIKLIKADGGEVKTNNHVENDDESWQTIGAKNKGSLLRKATVEKSPINDIFGGSLKSKIHRTGDQSSENTQPFFTLQLNIEKVKTVKEALELLTTKYKLEGLTSSKTNQEVEAWQQVMLDELPIVLILHLKCFDFKLDGCTKIIKALEFPIDLKIDAKLISTKPTNAKEKQYKLFAVVYHDGKEASKGHYVTDAFHVGYSSWLRYDDASVKPVQADEVLHPQGTRVPYLLFYRRSDTIRSK